MAAVLLATTTIAAPALAQDGPAPGELTADGFDRASHFDGPYIAGFGGYSIPKSGRGDTIIFDRNGDGTFGDQVSTQGGADAFSPGFCNGYFTSTANNSCRDDRAREEYGARIGYDRRMGNIVFGGLLEVNRSPATDATSAFSITPAAYQITRRLDYGISARARLGFTPGGGALFYATGGATYARIDHDFQTTNTANSFTPNRDSKMQWGWQAGGGAEVMVTNNISLGLEYLHTRITDDDYTVTVGQGTALPTNPFVLNGGGTELRNSEKFFTTNTFRAVVGLRF
jgi:hypothetical protein